MKPETIHHVLSTGNSARALGTINCEALSNENEQSYPEPNRSANPFDGGFFDVSNKNESGKDKLIRMVDGQDDPEPQAAGGLALQAWRALESV
ncbi:uncharacterized protein N7529_000990 [Penicillium soppii]|uniref:uncharacterized protein n=1 Tax=Penicillium soppii TaxID=69789 RepID=UPI002549939E|nr:uncharacterized protein N7529_000990 [Penicillium soppii]KAJ5882318.1 hypothetical protein N7529_000990 [Penicillium soppii]